MITTLILTVCGVLFAYCIGFLNGTIHARKWFTRTGKWPFLLIVLFMLTPSAQAQLSTNVIEIRVRFASGSPSTTLTLDPIASKKDKARLEALVWHFTNTGGTNEFTQWIAKTWTKDKLDELTLAKQEADAFLKQLRDDVNTVLKQNPEDVTTNEFTTLQAIAAKKQ